MIECVPNFSEGRNTAAVRQISDAIAAVPGVHLANVTSDRDHHRSVITFLGPLPSVENAAIEAARVAIQIIDLRQHSGVHPRIGAIDVIPFVPLGGSSLEECGGLARRVAAELWRRFALPSFFYEAAAQGRGLEDVRRVALAGAVPDTGEGRHPSAGAVAIGARRFLVAWNILLDTQDVSIAKRIARQIRHSSGGFPGVKALGLALEVRGCVQVSINSTDFEATPLHVIFAAVEQSARLAGVEIQGSELIGMVPRAALHLSTGCDLHWINFSPDMILDS